MTGARAQLGTLEASGLIEIAALQPELEYLFRHALVQEAAYASLLKQDRRQLHSAAADTILSLHPDRERELASVIAMHLEHAGQTSRAADYMVLAGEHAIERFANKESIAFFQRAGALADESQVDLKMRAAIGSARAGWTYNEPGTDIDNLERALVAADRTEPLLVTEAYFWVAFLRRQRGEVPASSPELRHAVERGTSIGETLKDPTVAAVPKALMGSFMAFTGELREGAREMSEALDAIEAKADPVSTSMVSVFLALAYARLGEFAAAEAAIARGDRSAAGSDAIARVDVDIARSALDLERGEPEKACTQASECAVRAEGLGAYACVVASNVMFGAASLAREDPSMAKPPLERGTELSRVTNMAALRTLTYGLLGSARARLGDVPGGVQDWDEALASAHQMGDRYGEAQTLWGRGRTHLQNKDWLSALPDLDRAMQLFEAMEARPALARVLHDRAETLRGLGRAAEGDEVDRRSADLWRQLGLRDRPTS